MLMLILITFSLLSKTKLFVPLVILSAKDNQKLTKLFAKDLKDQCIEINIKQKVTIKVQQISFGLLKSRYQY